MKALDGPMLLALAAIAVAVLAARSQTAETGNSTWIPVDEPLLQDWAESADGMELLP